MLVAATALFAILAATVMLPNLGAVMQYQVMANGFNSAIVTVMVLLYAMVSFLIGTARRNRTHK